MSRKTGIEKHITEATKNRKLSALPTKTSVYESLLDKSFNLGLEYANQGEEQKRDIANSISAGGAMTSYNRGDIGSFDWNIARDAVIDRARTVGRYMGTGLYDTEEYATHPAYSVLSSTDYLNNLLELLNKKKAEWSAEQENLYRQNKANLPEYAAAQRRAAEWRNFFSLAGYEDEPSLENMLKAESINNGGAARSVRDFDMMDDETFDQEYVALEAWYKGLDPNALMADPEAPVLAQGSNPELDSKIKTVSEELRKRAELEALQADIRSNANYNSLAAYTGTALSEGAWLNGGLVAREDIDALNSPYSFINSGASWDQAYNASEKMANVAKYLSEGYDFMTPEEISDYNALINAGRTDDAARYLELLRGDLLVRRAEVYKEYQTVKAQNPVLAVPAFFEAGMQEIGNVFSLPFQIYETATGRDNPLSSAYDAKNKSEWTTEAQQELIDESDMPDWLKKGVSYLYGGAVSVRDNVARIIAGGGNPTVALALAGLQSASGSLKESAGNDDVSAAAKIVKAIGTGAIEVGTEKIGLDALFSKGKNGALSYIKQVILSEVGEETLNALSEPALEAVVASLFDHEADIKSGPEFWSNLTDTVITTAISSLIMGGGGAVSQNSTTRSIGKRLLKNGDLEAVLRIADAYSNNADVAEPAKKIREKQSNGHKVSTRDVGELVTAVSETIGEKNRADVDNVLDSAITDRMVELGESEEVARQAAPIIRRMYQGDKVKPSERQAIIGTDNGIQVFKELNTTSKLNTDNVVPGAVEGTEGQQVGGTWVAGDARGAEGRRVGQKWRNEAVGKINAINRDAAAEGRRFNEALTTKTSTTTAAAKAVKKAQETMKGKEKLEATQLAYDNGADGKGIGTFRHVKKENGKFLVALKDAGGKTIEVEADKIDNAGDANLLAVLNYAQEGAKYDMTATEVNEMVAVYDKFGGDFEKFVRNYEDTYLAGYAGLVKPTTSLPENVSDMVYNYGVENAKTDEEARAANAGTRGNPGTGKVSWIGKVASSLAIGTTEAGELTEEAISKMKDSQQTVVKVITALAERMKVDVVLFESDLNNASEIENGSFVPGTNSIYVDINSGVSSQEDAKLANSKGTLGYAMLKTMSHELTHYMESNSPEGYAQYKHAVKDALKLKNVDWAELVREKLDNAISAGQKLSYKGAEAEVVADASEYMLQDSKFVRDLDPSLKGKIKHFIQDFAKQVREIFATLTGHRESDALRKTIDGVRRYTSELQKLWDAGLTEAVETVQAKDAAVVPAGATEDEIAEAAYSKAQRSVRVRDKETVAYLENQQHITTYRAMQVIDGKLYPPMAEFIGSKKDGNREDSSAIGRWEMATEHPELIKWVDGKPKFELKKVNDDGSVSVVPAAYNPYMHSSNTVLNDQFSKAFQRNNLVVVECVVPVSESNGAYHAQYAKDATGWHEWKSGVVAGDLAKQKTGFKRDVFLSRYIKPVRILSDAEVAEKIAGYLDGTDVTVPFQSVWPTLRDALVQAGVDVTEPRALGPAQMKIAMEAYNEWKRGQGEQQENENTEKQYQRRNPLDRAINTYYSDEKLNGALTSTEYRQLEDRLHYRILFPEKGKRIAVGQDFAESITAHGDQTKLVVMRRDTKLGVSILDVYNVNIRLYNGRIADVTTTIEEGIKEYGAKWFEHRHRSFLGNDHEKIFSRFDRHDRSFPGVSSEGTIREGTQKAAGYSGIRGDRAGDAGSNQVKQSTLNDSSETDTVPIESIQPQKQFALRSSVEARDDGLMAIHNLKESDVAGTLDLGGFPMPSIAIVKAKHGHTMYGEYSVIFGREAIDPEADYRNRVYGADAWTPVFPTVETELLGDVMYDVQNEIGSLAQQVDDEFKHRSNTFFGNFAGDDGTHYTLDDLLNKMWNNYGMLGAYKVHRGEPVEILTRDVQVDRGFYPDRADVYEQILDVVGNDLVTMPMHQILDVYGEQLAQIKRPFAAMIAKWNGGDRQAGARMAEILKQAVAYEGSGRDRNVHTTKKNDYYDTENALKASIDRNDFNAWATSIVNRFLGQQGIYNGKERFTAMGNRRTFKQTHMPLTAENVVKSMLTQQESNIPATDAHGLMAAAAARYESIDEIRADSARLGKISDEEYRARLADADNDLRAFLNAIEAWDYDQQEEVGDLLVKAAKSKMTAARIRTLFGKNGYTISTEASKMATRLIAKVQSIPTGYFEAKPARVVDFGEIKMLVAPDAMPKELAERLDEMGIPYTTYDGTDADRLIKVNAVENVQFSLRDASSSITIRDYLAGMEPTRGMTETEKLLLKRYKENLQTVAEKQELIDQQDTILANGGPADEMIKAKNRKKIYSDQLKRAERALRDAESSEGFANIMATSQNVIQQYLIGASGSVADAADALDAEIKGLSEQLVKLNSAVQRTADGQRTAFARGLFKQSDLNATAKNLKANYGSRMSEKTIADRLALAFGEIYASNDAEGAKRFAEATRSLAEDILRGNKYRYKSEVLPLLASNIGTIALSGTDVQEIKNAGISISEYKRMLSPYIKVSIGGDALSSHASNAEYYGNGALNAVLGDDTEGNLAMRLYKTVSAEKTKEADNGFDGMDEGTLLGMIMADIAGSSLPLTDDSRTATYLRNELLKHAGESEAAAKAINTAIAKAKATTAKASSVWREAVKAQTTARNAVEYYRALEEQRRVLELKEQKETITSQLRTEHAKELSERLTRQKNDFFTRRDINIEIGKRTRHIKRIVRNLNDRIVHEEDYKNVKEPLKPAVHKLVHAFIDGFGSMVFDQKTAGSLRTVYDEIAKDDAAPEFYSDDVSEWLQDLATMQEWDAIRRAESNSTIEALTEKLVIYSKVEEIADHIYHLVQNADTMFVEGKRAVFSAYAKNIGDDLKKREDRKLLAGVAGKAQKAMDDLILKGNMIPQFFFESLKNSGLMGLYDNLQQGQRDYAASILDGQKTVTDAKERYNYYSWSNAPDSFHTQQGHDITLTLEQKLWVYATAKREATNKLMDTHHLDQGGFKYDANSLPKEGWFKVAAGATKAHRLSAADVKAITDTLTADQKAYADELVEYLSNDMADVGNRASMELFGIKKYNEEYYFPFKTDSGSRYQRSDAGSASTTNDARVKHSSFTHSLRKGANTTLVMGNFTDIVADHINLMSTYASFVVPIENLNRVLNRKVDDDGTEVTIRNLIGYKYGTPAQKYIADLLKDLNGGPAVDNRGNLSGMLRAFKRSAVMGSLSVAVQQPTAYLRAFAYIDPKYFAHLTMQGSKDVWDTMLKHSGTAVIKDMGRFDVGMGKGANDWIADNGMSGFKLHQRMKFLLGQKEYKAAADNFVEFLTALPGYFDRVTWTHIWKAISAEQHDLHPSMDVNSNEFLDMVGKRFDDVINHTQVYDSILSRSQNMRSKNALTQMSTSFMSEPTLNANLAYSAFTGGHGKKQGTKMITATIASNLAAAALAAAVSAWRKDDDDRTALEKYLATFANRAVDNLNPATMIPFVSDLWNMVSGYDVERTDWSVAKDIIDYSGTFFSKWFDDEKQLKYTDFENFFGSLLNAAGIPYKNVSRDFRSAVNFFKSDKSIPTSAGVKYTLIEELVPFWKDSNKAYCQRFVSAIADGDKQAEYDLWDYMKNTKGVSQGSLETNIRDALKGLVQAGVISASKATEILRKYVPYKNDKDNINKPQEWLKTK